MRARKLRVPRASLISFALALSLGAPAALAQTQPAPPMELTLADALRRAAADPPAVRVALARAESARAQIDQASAGYYPTVTASGSASLGFTDQPVLANLRYQSVTMGLNAGITARVPIYDFGRTGNAVTAATRGSAAAREDVRTARVQAMSAVASAYLTVLSDQEAVNAARAVLEQREAHLRIAEGLVNAGARPPIERTRAQIDLEAGRLDLTSAETRARNDRATLAVALGMDPLRDLTLAPLPDALLTVDDDPAHAAAIAVEHRPEFAAARARVAQAEAQYAQTRAGRLPILSAQGSASVNYSERLTGQGAFGLSEQVQGSVNLTWPLYDPSVGANTRAAEANVSSARETLLQQSLTVRSAAAQAAISLQGARLSREQSERYAVTAAANLDQATGRYQGGAAPMLELVDAQAADASARYAVIRARLAEQIARVTLLTAMGDLDRLR